MKKLLPPTLFILFAAMIAALAIDDECYLPLSMPYNFSGLILVIFGVVLAYKCSNLFKKFNANISTFGAPTRLIRIGAYQYTRNPMYLGFVIALIGVVLLSGAGLGQWLMLAIFWFITDRWYIQYEEKAMEAIYGDRYLRYKQKVRRWL